MKTAASVLSWIGGIITAVSLWVSCGIYASQFHLSGLLAIPAVYMIVDLSILSWRQVAVNRGNKVGPGVLTLIFCSVIGGILTLCIPESQLLGTVSYSSNSASATNQGSSTSSDFFLEYSPYNQQTPTTSPTSQTSQKTLSEVERIELVKEYKKLLDDGAITEEEFAKKKKELLQI